jgi:D-serine dehydratase
MTDSTAPSPNLLHQTQNYKNKGAALVHRANLLNDEVLLPTAVIYQSRLLNNLNWMQSFSEHYGLQLAPHGKTSMTPAMFIAQQNTGAWGMTLASVQQVQVAVQHNIKRILMANQLVGKANMRLMSDLLNNHDFEFYCLLDSVENAEQVAEFFAEQNQTINVLIEIGVSGGRCGCRNETEIDNLLAAIKSHETLNLVGIEFYEGVIHNKNEVQEITEFVAYVVNLSQKMNAQGHFSIDKNEKPIITGAGSAWYDLVAEGLTTLKEEFNCLIRPGCYGAHDVGIYQDAQNKVRARSTVACSINAGRDLESALEVWATVQSIPEKGLAVIAMGKRDIAFDAGLPTPQLLIKRGSKKAIALTQGKITDIMDQHAFFNFKTEFDKNTLELAVGDVIAFACSHPCLTFDKWRSINLIDDKFNVIEAMPTYF